ncbi:hypothetical protein BC831DRAFT_402713 [Entophlyctis helioformis]|nr:hypothetical protein BC831DRAFT_402713 [Entophlyctis helioformis]
MRGPLLLIFDLNGTLVERLKSGSEYKAARTNPFLPALPDFGFRGSKCFLRPHVDSLFRFTASLPNITVGVWTSAQPENAFGLTRLVLSERQLSQASFIWDRTHCDNAPLDRSSSKVLKDLTRIWRSSEVNPRGIWSEVGLRWPDHRDHSLQSPCC